MDEKLLYNDKKNCCGCGACENACPTNAISMKEDEYGFTFPTIDQNKCINCKKCISVCHLKTPQKTNMPIKTFVAINTDETALKTSASGGVFSALAESVIDANGLVYGCILGLKDGVLTPYHAVAKTKEEYKAMQGSKYVQSDIGLIYQDVKANLEKGVTVLFSGTPCQVAGLKSYLPKHFDNLYTADIVCHGTPSKKMFSDYMALNEKKVKGKITNYRFRDKSDGWGLTARIYYLKKNGKEKTLKIQERLSSYYHLFLSRMTYRDSCYSCKYASPNRVGDITIGDYWGIESAHPEYLIENGGKFDQSKGTSCLMVNNEKGKELLDKFGGSLTLLDSTFEKARKDNGQLNAPALPNPERDAYLEEYKTNGIYGFDKKYQKSLGVKRYVYAFKNKFSQKFKYRLKKILTFGRSK